MSLKFTMNVPVGVLPLIYLYSTSFQMPADQSIDFSYLFSEINTNTKYFLYSQLKIFIQEMYLC